MTDLLKIHKINAPLPSQLEPNSIYYVKDGSSIKQYVTNSIGDLPYTTHPDLELDLKAPLDSPTFTGNLVLPNNSRINGIEHFYQTTKPITRGDGSALVIGDRWWKTDEGTEWFWNGTYWLSSIQYNLIINFGITQFVTSYYSGIISNKIFIKSTFLNISNTDALAQSGWFWESEITFCRGHDEPFVGGILPRVRVTFDGVTTASHAVSVLNLFLDLPASQYNYILATLSKGGNPSTFNIAGSTGFLYHLVQ